MVNFALTSIAQSIGVSRCTCSSSYEIKSKFVKELEPISL